MIHSGMHLSAELSEILQKGALQYEAYFVQLWIH